MRPGGFRGIFGCLAATAASVTACFFNPEELGQASLGGTGSGTTDAAADTGAEAGAPTTTTTGDSGSGETAVASSTEISSETDAASTGPGVGDPPATPVLSLGFSPVKQFEFSWPATAGAVTHQVLERTGPDAAFLPLGDELVGEALTWPMPLHLRRAAGYRLRACNDAGCTDSDVVDVADSLAAAVGYFKASNTAPGDLFGACDYGRCVALSQDGSTLAIGARGEQSKSTGVGGDDSDNSMPGAGAVYVFKRDGDTWVQESYVKSANMGSDSFGTSVALSDDGETLAVGAPAEDGSAVGVDGVHDDLAASAGAAYVFVRDGGTWVQEAYVKASNTRAGDHFGNSIALSGDGSTLVVGADSEDGGDMVINGDDQNFEHEQSGAAYVFVRGATQWEQQAYIKAFNSDPFDNLGQAVALSDDGDTLAVSTRREWGGAKGIDGDPTDNSLQWAGAVYVYRRTGTSWSHESYIKASLPAKFAAFGWSIALSGDGATLAVGAPSERGAATTINGDEQDLSLQSAGAVYVFTRDAMAEKWSQEAYVKPFNTGEQDLFGASVALSDDGRLLAVGAKGESSAAVGVGGDGDNDDSKLAGAVHMFTRDEQGWAQTAYVKAPNTGANDGFGQSLALSGDGRTLAVGAAEDSAAIDIGGNQSNNSALDAGAVYVY